MGRKTAIAGLLLLATAGCATATAGGTDAVFSRPGPQGVEPNGPEIINKSGQTSVGPGTHATAEQGTPPPSARPSVVPGSTPTPGLPAPDVGQASPEPTPTATPNLAAELDTRPAHAVKAAAGGTVEENGIKVVFPPGSLSQDTQVRLLWQEPAGAGARFQWSLGGACLTEGAVVTATVRGDDSLLGAFTDDALGKDAQGHALLTMQLQGPRKAVASGEGAAAPTKGAIKVSSEALGGEDRVAFQAGFQAPPPPLHFGEVCAQVLWSSDAESGLQGKPAYEPDPADPSKDSRVVVVFGPEDGPFQQDLQVAEPAVFTDAQGRATTHALISGNTLSCAGTTCTGGLVTTAVYARAHTRYPGLAPGATRLVGQLSGVPASSDTSAGTCLTVYAPKYSPYIILTLDAQPAPPRGTATLGYSLNGQAQRPMRFTLDGRTNELKFFLPNVTSDADWKLSLTSFAVDQGPSATIPAAYQDLSVRRNNVYTLGLAL